MCSPTIAMFAISAVTSIGGYIAERKQAKLDENAARNERTLLLQDLAARSEEVDGSAASEKSDLAIAALAKKGTIRVASGENLGMGVTSQLLLQDVYAQEGREVTSIDVSRKRSQKQIQREREGVQSRASTKLNSIKQPSLFKTGLQIAGSATEAFGNKTPSKITKTSSKITKTSSKGFSGITGYNSKTPYS